MNADNGTIRRSCLHSRRLFSGVAESKRSSPKALTVNFDSCTPEQAFDQPRRPRTANISSDTRLVFFFFPLGLTHIYAMYASLLQAHGGNCTAAGRVGPHDGFLERDLAIATLVAVCRFRHCSACLRAALGLLRGIEARRRWWRWRRRRTRETAITRHAILYPSVRERGREWERVSVWV